MNREEQTHPIARRWYRLSFLFPSSTLFLFFSLKLSSTLFHESINFASEPYIVPLVLEGQHRLVECPDCQSRLGGISLARCREVIDVPPLPVVEVTEHRIDKGWCSHCQKWHEAPVDLSEHLLGQGRIGVRLASMIAYLRTVMRLPLRQLEEVLPTLHGFEVSLGELVELLQRIAEYAQPVLEGLKAEVRA